MEIAVSKIDLGLFIVYGSGVKQDRCHSAAEWPFGEVTIKTLCMAHDKTLRCFVSVPCTLTLRRSVVSTSESTRFRLRLQEDWREQLPPRLFPGPLSLTWHPAGALIDGAPADSLERGKELHAVTEFEGVQRAVYCGKITDIAIR